MFTPGVIVIKIPKLAHFLYSLLMTAKKSVTVQANFLSTPGRCYLAPSENIMDYWNLSYH